MRIRSIVPLGFVADGRWRHLRSEEFRAQERAARAVVVAEFSSRMATAEGWRERLFLHWQQFCALSRVSKRLRPSPQSCFLHVAGPR